MSQRRIDQHQKPANQPRSGKATNRLRAAPSVGFSFDRTGLAGLINDCGNHSPRLRRSVVDLRTTRDLVELIVRQRVDVSSCTGANETQAAGTKANAI